MTVHFRAHLQRGGIGIQETKRLLEALADHQGDWEAVRRACLDENLLGKTSDSLVRDLLKAFRRRFLLPTGLPPAELVAKMVRTSIPEAAKRQVLLPYFLLSDSLVRRCYKDLVLQRLNSHESALTRNEVQQHLELLSVEHPELAKWSEYLRQKWARAFLTLLRRFGFLCLWFWLQDGSFWSIWEREIWTLLQLDDLRKEELLAEGHERGWWTYQRLGEIVHFQPRFNDLKGWIRNGLA